MSPLLIFWITLVVLLFTVVYLDVRYGLLRDISEANQRPYSFARVQLTWWSVIIFASFISIIISTGIAPTFNSSTLILLGISSATTAAARIIDRSDQTNPTVTRTQNENSENFLLDILSDENGVSIHRFQTIVLNIVFGIWFICTVLSNIDIPNVKIDLIMPFIADNNLILLGLSSGTYVVLKTNENKK